MTVCKAFSSVDNQTAPAISGVLPSRSYSDENKSAPELERVSGDTENLYLRCQLQQQQEEFSLKEQPYQRLVAEAHATEKLAQAIGKAINAQPKPMEG